MKCRVMDKNSPHPRIATEALRWLQLIVFLALSVNRAGTVAEAASLVDKAVAAVA